MNEQMIEGFRRLSESTSEAKKIKDLKQNLKIAKNLLKNLDINESIDIAKEKTKQIIYILYNKHHLEKQYSYLDNKRKTEDIIMQAYNIILNKETQIKKLEEKLKAKLD